MARLESCRFNPASLIGKIILALPPGAEYEPPVASDGGLVTLPTESLVEFAAQAVSHLSEEVWNLIITKARIYRIEDGDA